MPNRNIESLKHVATRLGPLVAEVVFVGGCTTGLFITDKAAAEVRATFDVDVIAEIASYAEYATFSERLRDPASQARVPLLLNRIKEITNQK